MENILQYIYIDGTQGYLLIFAGVDYIKIQINDIQFSFLRAYDVETISAEFAKNLITNRPKNFLPSLERLKEETVSRVKIGHTDKVRMILGLFNATRVTELRTRDFARYYEALITLIPL